MRAGILATVLASAGLCLAVVFLVPVARASVIGGTPPPGVDGCTGQSCTVQSLISSGTVTTQAPSGQYSFQPTVAGSRLGMGPGANQWWTCPDAGKCLTDAVLWLGGGVDMRNGTLNDSYAGAVRINSVDGFAVLVQGTAPPTCTTAFIASGGTRNVGPGALFTEAGAAGKPTKLCLCTYDGTTYRWYNLLNPSSTAGTSTSCPEYP